MSATEAIHITDIGTVGVPVNSQDRALEFYQEKLGFELRMDGTFGEGLRWIEVAPPGASTSVALVLASEANPAGIDTGVRFSTQDAAADHAALQARSVDVDAEVLAFPVPMFTLRDPDGNQLYVVERPDTM
jgi:catechol 2,3-dioxygenase-like lactoylglutathione lyase family enzyme